MFYFDVTFECDKETDQFGGRSIVLVHSLREVHDSIVATYGVDNVLITSASAISVQQAEELYQRNNYRQCLGLYQFI